MLIDQSRCSKCISNTGKIEKFRILRMSLFGDENSNFSKTDILRNNDEFKMLMQTQVFDEIDYFHEQNSQPLKMAFFQSMIAILR